MYVDSIFQHIPVVTCPKSKSGPGDHFEVIVPAIAREISNPLAVGLFHSMNGIEFASVCSIKKEENIKQRYSKNIVKPRFTYFSIYVLLLHLLIFLNALLYIRT
jgi:hypothetical protein